jgi:hypothetical protein
VQNAVVAGAHRQQTRYRIARRRPFRVVHKHESATRARTMPVQPKNINRCDQRAVCFASRAVRRPCPPFDDARSASQIARSSRACMVQDRRSSGLPSAARRRALRSGFVSLGAALRPPLHFPRSPTADRSLFTMRCATRSHTHHKQNSTELLF